MPDFTARQLAIDTRLRLGLQSTEYMDVDRAITSLNITCIKRPLESSMSGATLKTGRVKAIMVNTSKTLGHQHFTVAHELYHCLYDDDLESRACRVETFGRTSQNEKLAELFAVNLLMPDDAVFNQLRLRGKVGLPLTLADVVNLEQFFGVSRRAMCWRLEDLRSIRREQSDQWCRNVIRSARTLGKDTNLYMPTHENALISDYAEKAAEALEKGLITDSKYEELLAEADLLELVTGVSEEADIAD